MSLTFQNFKQEISSQILQRGRTYFRDGNITDLEMQDEDIWSAQVSGSEDYDVTVEQGAGGELQCSCSCPYDGGPICKHIAAVLYAIEDTFPDSIGTAGTGKRKPRSVKRETKEEKLRKALDKASREALVAALLDIAKDKHIANQLLLRFGAVSTDKGSVAKAIKEALRARMDHGFIDYYAAGHAARAVEQFLNRADQLLAEGDVEAAVATYQAVLETVTNAIGQADDSNGELGSCMALAIEGLQKAASAANPAQRSALFAQCLQDAQSPVYSGWDARWDLFELAADMVKTRQERDTLFSVLDAFDKPPKKPNLRKVGMLHFMSADDIDGFTSQFDAERAASLKLSIIQREDGEAAADKFIRERVYLDRFRKLLIERSLKNNDLAFAKQLATEGVTLNQQGGYAGLVWQYQQYLIEIAQREGDKDTVIKLAREMFLTDRAPEYYDVLKTTVGEQQWPAFLKALIRDAKAQRFGTLIYWIYAREGMWRELLDQAGGRWNQTLEQYRTELEKRFGNEVAALYEKSVYALLKDASGRDAYKNACQYLRRMQKLGQSARAAEIAKEMKARYPQRRAMIEELNKL